jgi:tRNA-Thr(GGU) m(6)t(6)A37 methyltransferase TsaA
MSRISDTGESIRIEPIGIIRTPFMQASGTPIQSAYGRDVEGKVIIGESFASALEDIEGFERIWLVYWMDRTGPFQPSVIPYRDNRKHGLFATRSPCRPNPIGLSVVRLLKREGSVLYVRDIDILDSTLLIDIKPYIPEFDAHSSSRAGWFEKSGVNRRKADSRFHSTDLKRRTADGSESMSKSNSVEGRISRRGPLSQKHKSNPGAIKNC